MEALPYFLFAIMKKQWYNTNGDIMKNAFDRKEIKMQAKEYIRRKVLPLFLITLVVYALMSCNTFISTVKDFDKLKNPQSLIDEIEQDARDGDFSTLPSAKDIALGGLSTLTSAFALIFGPLNVTLCAMYVMLVRRSPEEAFDVGKEMGAVFKNTFNASYGKKLVAVLVKNVILVLLTMCFIVPGVVFFMSAYFTYQLLSDYPNLRVSDAIALSKKIVKGNRTELFVMNLSFFGWALLTLISFGIVGIYALPYKCTVDALYYENFRQRAIADGRVTKYDFMNSVEKAAAYHYESQMAQQQYPPQQ